MKNRLASLLSSMVKWVRPKLPPPTTPALSPEQFRKMLEEVLTDPQTVRLFAKSLLYSGLPVQGGICNDNPASAIGGSAAADRTFGGQCSNPDFYFPSKIGIGTASPAVKLQVNDTDSTSIGVKGFVVRNDVTADYLNIWNYGANVYAIESADEATYRDLSFQPHGGKVGIGTTTPGAKLEVKGSDTGNVLLGELGGAPTYGAIGLANSLAAGSYNFTSSASDTNLYINRPTGKAIKFRENNAAADQMTILSGGNVGIGTTSPQQKLHVKSGNIAVEPYSGAANVDQGFALLKLTDPPETDPTTILYRQGGSGEEQDVTILRTFKNHAYGTNPIYTILSICSPRRDITTQETEATLALCRGGVGSASEFMDLYNNGYTGETQYGVRIQKRGTGAAYRDFVFDQYDGTTHTPLMILKANTNVGIGISSPNFVLHTSGAAVALGAPSSAPSDSSLNSSNISFFLDETNHKLKIKVKYSDGTTLKTGEITLT